MQQEDIIAVEHELIHRISMLFPYRTAVESAVGGGVSIDVVKAAEPGESRWIGALEELAERDCIHLLDGFREIALEIPGKVFALARLNGVAAEFNDGEVLQMVDVIGGVLCLG